MGNCSWIGNGKIQILRFVFQSITRNLWRKYGNCFRRRYDSFAQNNQWKSIEPIFCRIVSSSSKRIWFSRPIFCTHSRYSVKPFERMRPLLLCKCGIPTVSFEASYAMVLSTLSALSLRRDQWIARVDLSCRSLPWFRLPLTTNILWRTDQKFFQNLLCQTVRKIFFDDV